MTIELTEPSWGNCSRLCDLIGGQRNFSSGRVSPSELEGSLPVYGKTTAGLAAYSSGGRARNVNTPAIFIS